MQPDENRYDLFISYADADHAWVEGYLRDALEKAGARCLTEAAFELGVPRLLEFERAVQQSRRILLILSPPYLVENFIQFADLLAQHYGLETATWPVIPLILTPDLKLPLRLALLEPLEASDPADWPRAIERLCAALRRPVPALPPGPPPPYPGMAPFGEDDSARFFGRDREIRDLLERLRLHRFLAVIGPSGSGKSSLVFAGLIPALRKSGLFGSGEWMVKFLRPGETPLATLQTVVGDTLNLQPADQPPATGDVPPVTGDLPKAVTLRPATYDLRPAKLLLIVDQFEELFTLAGKDAVPFQEALLAVAKFPHCHVVLTARADFYPDLMASPLWPEIQAHRVEVLPLDAEGLKQAIVRPAEDVGVYVEAALVERLVGDAAGEPGMLPFVQETLVLLWERLERRFLPLRAYEALILSLGAYQAAGDVRRTGLQVAMARRAEAALADLTPAQQAIARRIFLRLVQFGEGRADTRRQQPVAALRSPSDLPGELDRTLEHLVSSRLLTLDAPLPPNSGGLALAPGLGGQGGRADIAHEALITGWPTLQQWVQEGRAAELTRRQVGRVAEEWSRHHRDNSYLYRGMRLAEAQAWAQHGPVELGELEKPFLEQSSLRQERQRRIVATGMTGGMIAIVVILWLLTPPLLIRIKRESIRRHIGTGLVSIAGGLAIVGSTDPAAESNEELSRPNLLPFEIEKYEVSMRQYEACMEYGPCTAPQFPDILADTSKLDYPMVHVSARQAETYCQWLDRRLPTSVEWERAARGVKGRLWPWGDVPRMCEEFSFGCSKVAVNAGDETATPPPEKIYHLGSNVSELVVLVPNDCQAEDCHAPWDGKTDRIALMGNASDVGFDRISYKNGWSIDNSDESVGFRCVAQKR